MRRDRSTSLVRRFNRFYTRRLGVLGERPFDGRYSLGEGRILYELAQREGATASELGHDLGLDAGYVSRIIAALARARLISRTRSTDDRRQFRLELTARGRKAFGELDTWQESVVADQLAPMSERQRGRLVAAMATVEQLLDDARPAAEPYSLRAPRPGDMGWIVHRQGILYAQEYGWDEQFEALAAQVVAEFVLDFDARCERCWIAERDGEIVGSIFLVSASATVAKLRLLYVEPDARGLGIGRRLVDELIRNARRMGYKKITLWTQRNLLAARSLYRAAGFRRVSSKKHHTFGHDLVSETWELAT